MGLKNGSRSIGKNFGMQKDNFSGHKKIPLAGDF